MKNKKNVRVKSFLNWFWTMLGC